MTCSAPTVPEKTLAYLITDLPCYVPTHGVILIYDKLLNQMPSHERVHLDVLMSLKEPTRFDGLRVKDYLTLGKKRLREPTESLQRGAPAWALS